MTLTNSSAPFRILIADDNVVNQKVLSIMLRKAGFQADVVPDGDGAATAHQTRPYHLILMDLHMPDMDGYEATRRIRLLPQAQPIIVAVTASVLPEAREQCFACGMDDYLSKPFKRDELLTVVRKAQERCLRADEITIAG